MFYKKLLFPSRMTTPSENPKCPRKDNLHQWDDVCVLQVTGAWITKIPESSMPSFAVKCWYGRVPLFIKWRGKNFSLSSFLEVQQCTWLRQFTEKCQGHWYWWPQYVETPQGYSQRCQSANLTHGIHTSFACSWVQRFPDKVFFTYRCQIFSTLL